MNTNLLSIIGLMNKSKNLEVIQIGLWNINEKRKISFNQLEFKSKKLKS
ncbi:hypothetical protein [Chryseobacterium aquaticum]